MSKSRTNRKRRQRRAAKRMAMFAAKMLGGRPVSKHTRLGGRSGQSRYRRAFAQADDRKTLAEQLQGGAL